MVGASSERRGVGAQPPLFTFSLLQLYSTHPTHSLSTAAPEPVRRGNEAVRCGGGGIIFAHPHTHTHTQHTLSSYLSCIRVDDSSIIHFISAASRPLPFSHASLLLLETPRACVPSLSLPTSSLCRARTHTQHTLATRPPLAVRRITR